MRADIKNIDINEVNNKVLITIKTNSQNPTFLLKKRKNHRDFDFSQEETVTSTEIQDSHFRIEVNVDQLLNQHKGDKEAKWLIYMCVRHEEVVVDATAMVGYKAKHFYKEGSTFKVVPYITQDKTFAFLVREIEVHAKVTNLEYAEGQMMFDMELYGNDYQYLNSNSGELCFKRRVQTDTQFYIETLTAMQGNFEQTTRVKLNIKERLIANYHDKEACWDLFIKLQDEHEKGRFALIPLKVEQTDKNKAFRYHSIQKNTFVKAKPFITGNQHVALYVSDIPNKMIATHLIDEESFIELQVEARFNHSSSLSEGKLVIKRRCSVGKDFEYHDEEVYEMELNDKQLTVRLPKQKLLSIHHVRPDETWDFFIRLKDANLHQADLHIDIPNEVKRAFPYFELSESAYKAKLFVNGASRLSLYVSKALRINNNAAKVAVLGTCFSRNAFNSTQYFNPGYKEMFKCVFTQFHSSVVSLVSQPVDLNQFNLAGINERDLTYVKIDHEKTFFEELKQANVDYLIIDLYSDASKSLFKLSEDQYVSNSYILEESDYVKSVNNVEVITHEDSERYFSIWKKAVQQFVVKLKEVLPEEKIILNKGRFTDVYLDESRNIKRFSDPDLIKRNNLFWEKLDNYFIHLMPQVKVIDLTDTPYIGDIKYPFGLSYSHYETGYYKEFLNRLTKIVLTDQLNK